MEREDIEDVWELVPGLEPVTLLMLRKDEQSFHEVPLEAAKLTMWSHALASREQYQQVRDGAWVFFRSVLDAAGVPQEHPSIGDRVRRESGEEWVLDRLSRVWLFDTELSFEAHKTAVN